MGKVIDTLLGEADSLDENDYRTFDYSNESLTSSSQSDLLIHTATIQSKSDMLEVEDALRSGGIVLVTVGPLTGALTREKVASFLQEAADEVDGDIVWRDEDELIVTPRGVSVSRSSLA